MFTIVKVPLAGGAVTTLARGNDWYPQQLAVDATSAYWTICPSCVYVGAPPMGGSVMKVPIAGGKVTTLVTGRNGVSALAVDETSVYWTEVDTAKLMRLTPK